MNIPFAPPAKRSVSYAVIPDDNAILTSTATDDEGANTYESLDLDGVIGAGVMNPPRQLTVKTAAVAGAYNTVDPIVVTGIDSNLKVQTEEFQPTDPDGGETLLSALSWRRVDSIDVPQQVDDDGAILVGVRDIFCTTVPSRIRVGGAGNLKVKYGDADATVDTLPFAAGETIEVAPDRIYGDADTTATGVVLLF